MSKRSFPTEPLRQQRVQARLQDAPIVDQAVDPITVATNTTQPANSEAQVATIPVAANFQPAGTDAPITPPRNQFNGGGAANPTGTDAPTTPPRNQFNGGGAANHNADDEMVVAVGSPAHRYRQTIAQPVQIPANTVFKCDLTKVDKLTFKVRRNMAVVIYAVMPIHKTTVQTRRQMVVGDETGEAMMTVWGNHCKIVDEDSIGLTMWIERFNLSEWDGKVSINMPKDAHIVLGQLIETIAIDSDNAPDPTYCSNNNSTNAPQIGSSNNWHHHRCGLQRRSKQRSRQLLLSRVSSGTTRRRSWR
jgi:hypothetical protein